MVRRARKVNGALCEVVIRHPVLTRMLNGWRYDRKRVEVRTWRATAVEREGKVVVRWEWRDGR